MKYCFLVKARGKLCFALALFIYSYRGLSLEKIDFRGLSSDLYWHKLIHYKKSAFGNIISNVDGGDFFYSKKGKVNPEEELRVSYKKLVSPFEGTDINKHPHCRFPSRMRWIKKVTDWKGDIVKCPDFDQWIKSLSAKGLALVYANNFPNNPASTFGHTFLKIISDDQAYVQNPKKGSKKIDLLNYAIGYSAEVPNHYYIDYFIKGIFGGYQSKFDLAPYYMKVREYNRSESRDLWEYHLNMTGKEVDLLLMHLWELGFQAEFNYYFFDENCSYKVLELIEIARPDWKLTEQFSMIVSPPETVKAVKNIPESVIKEVYRPSLYKRFIHKLSILDKGQKKQYKEVLDSLNKIEEISDPYVLETVISYFNYLKKKSPISFDEKFGNFYKKILIKRSKLEPIKDLSFDKVERPLPPDHSHDRKFARLSYGGGKNKRFLSFKFSPAMHDYLSDNTGQPNYSIYSFLTPDLHILKQNNENKYKVKLDNLTGIEVLSLFPSNEEGFKFSYSSYIGMNRAIDSFKNDLVVDVDIRVGTAFSLVDETLIFYVLPGASLEFDDIFKDNYRSILPLSLGLLFNFEKVKFLLSSDYSFNLMGQNYTKINLKGSYILEKNWEVRYSADLIYDDKFKGNSSRNEMKLGFVHYF